MPIPLNDQMACNLNKNFSRFFLGGGNWQGDSMLGMHRDVERIYSNQGTLEEKQGRRLFLLDVKT